MQMLFMYWKRGRSLNRGRTISLVDKRGLYYAMWRQQKANGELTYW